jgi:Phosphatidylinositol 3- and 4-kinase/FYVE zinc finger/Phosphoinositide 3-kinase family, accessory domain (PIK domain)
MSRNNKSRIKADPLQESIEQALMESELSYSAFLDDRHHQYTRAARKVRSKRRSLTNPEDTDSPTDSPEDSPEDSPPDSPEDSPTDSPMNSPENGSTDNLLSGLPIRPDINGSDEHLIGDDGSNSSNSSDVLIIDSVGNVPACHSIDDFDHLRAVGAMASDRVSKSSRMPKSIPARLSNFHRVDYRSDITSDDRGLLKEFGDSEVNGRDSIKIATRMTSSPIKGSKLETDFDIDLDDMLAREIENCSAIIGSGASGASRSSGADDIEVSRSSHNSDLGATDTEADILFALENEIHMSMKSVKKKKKKKPIESRGARRMMKWVNDESVDSCYGCSDKFTLVNGKHHCRLCGRIFCQRCSRYKTILPMDILKKIPDRPGSYTDFLFGETSDAKVRVCGDCFKYASDIIRIKKVIKVFELCGFNLIELNYLRDFNEDWKKAADFCIDRFREIQYKLSIEDLTSIEKKYIWVNRHLLSRHSRWMVLLFKSCNMSSPAQVEELRRIMRAPKRISCWDMKCSRFCSEMIQLGDMLDLVKYNNNDPVISDYIINCVSKIDGDILIDYLPFLVTNAVNNIFMIEILLDKSRDNFTLMTHVYWCIKAFVPNKTVRRNSIIQALKFIKEKCDEEFSSRFKVMIKNEILNMDWIRLQNEQTQRKIIVPVCPVRDFDSIDVDNIRVMDSNSRPVIIPFKTDTGDDKLIMYKEDDIRKDYVILGIINIVHRLLNEEVGMEIDTVKYRVMPTSEGTGYIEIVENARTIYDIIQDQTIQNYILNHNQDAVVSNIKDRFIKSTALYCVISYLFGFGDRHLENIMISESGLLFHIDFGYILGQDPKYTTNKSLRVTPEIINVIGGQNTENYRRFSQFCTQIYTCLRRHVNLFSNLLSVVPLIDPCISEEQIMHEIFDRFEVGENNLEAATHMDLKVRRDSGSFDYMIIDFLHRSKNTGLIKGLRYVKDVVFGTVYSGGS